MPRRKALGYPQNLIVGYSMFSNVNFNVRILRPTHTSNSDVPILVTSYSTVELRLGALIANVLSVLSGTSLSNRHLFFGRSNIHAGFSHWICVYNIRHVPQDRMIHST